MVVEPTPGLLVGAAAGAPARNSEPPSGLIFEDRSRARLARVKNSRAKEVETSIPYEPDQAPFAPCLRTSISAPTAYQSTPPILSTPYISFAP